jgi:hypothetical protein
MTIAIFPICIEVDGIVTVAVDFGCPVCVAGALHRAHVPGACPPSPVHGTVSC